MGTKIFDYLTESLLFDESLINEEFSSIGVEELRKELRCYREFCLSKVDEVAGEVRSDSSNLKAFSGIEKPNLRLLKQTAFYVEQYLLYDPLFPLTYESGEFANVMNQYLGFENKEMDKHQLAEVLRGLKALTPMVAADYVKFLPTSYFFEPPAKIPYRYSESGFADVLPEPLLNFFREHAIVEPVVKDDKGWRVGGKLDVGRGICVRFRGDAGVGGVFIYQLFEEQVVSVDQDKRLVQSMFYLPDTPPEPERFNAWVFQSINQSAQHLYDKVLLENEVAARFGASYMSRSEFVFRLLEETVSTDDNVATNTANVLLNMDLPFLEEVDIETLMHMRTEEGEAFQSFRLELDKQLRDLRLVKDPNELKIKAENAVHELSQVQIHEINKKVNELKSKLRADVAIIGGGLAAGIQTAGWSLIASALAAAHGYKTVKEYQSQLRQNPAFFLWKVLKSSR